MAHNGKGENMEEEIKSLKDVAGDIIYVMKKPIQLRAKQLTERVRIKTREGTLYGDDGDFLLEGIDFEVYPVGKSIFYRTYDILDGDEIEPKKQPKEKKIKEDKPENLIEINEDKEEVILARIVKKDGNLSIQHSKSASQFEVFGFLTIYIEAFAMDMANSLEGDTDFEIF